MLRGCAVVGECLRALRRRACVLCCPTVSPGSLTHHSSPLLRHPCSPPAHPPSGDATPTAPPAAPSPQVGAKAGVSQEALASTSTKVEAALADKQGLKDTLNKALGSGDATPAAAA